MARFVAIMLVSIVPGLPGFAQSHDAIAISIGLQIDSSIEIETISNINIGRVRPGDEVVTIDPRVDPGAGLIRLSGRPGGLVRISFVQRRELIRVGGGGAIQFEYQMSGNFRDEQSASQLVMAENSDLLLSDQGEYFLWIGGTLSLQGIVFGQYEGEFTIEVDYL